jgi:hypothetical protein
MRCVDARLMRRAVTKRHDAGRETQMLYLCEYKWQSGKSAEEIGRRYLELSENQDPALKIHHWYIIVGGGAGVIVGETDDPEALSRALTPWNDLVNWDVRAVFETTAEETAKAMRERLGQ